MENEENRGLIHQKDSEDQYTEFCQFNFGALSLFSLSHTLGYLEFSWSTLGECGMLGFLSNKAKEGQESARGHRDQQLQQIFLVRTELHVCFPH